MSELLLHRLSIVRANYKAEKPRHLKLIAALIIKLTIGGRRVIVPPDKWGQGWMPAPFNAYRNRFSIFVLLLYNGQFGMAKDIMINMNMPFLGIPKKAPQFQDMADSIMYNIHTILDVTVSIILQNPPRTSAEDLKREAEKVLERLGVVLS